MEHDLIMICDSADNAAAINTKTMKFHLKRFEISSFEKQQFFTIFSSVKHCEILDLISLKDHAIKLSLCRC